MMRFRFNPTFQLCPHSLLFGVGCFLKMPPGIPLCLQAGDERRRFLALFSLAFGDVSSNGFGTDLACRAAIVGAGPEMFFAGALRQRRELLSHDSRAVAFEQSNDLCRGIFRRCADKATHMINICFQRKQCKAVSKAAFGNRLLDYNLNPSRQNPAPILRNPYEVISGLIMTPSSFSGLQRIHDYTSIST